MANPVTNSQSPSACRPTRRTNPTSPRSPPSGPLPTTSLAVSSYTSSASTTSTEAGEDGYETRVCWRERERIQMTFSVLRESCAGSSVTCTLRIYGTESKGNSAIEDGCGRENDQGIVFFSLQRYMNEESKGTTPSRSRSRLPRPITTLTPLLPVACPLLEAHPSAAPLLPSVEGPQGSCGPSRACPAPCSSAPAR